MSDQTCHFKAPASRLDDGVLYYKATAVFRLDRNNNTTYVITDEPSTTLSRGEGEALYINDKLGWLDHVLSNVRKYHNNPDFTMEELYETMPADQAELEQYAGEYVDLDAPKEEDSTPSSLPEQCKSCGEIICNGLDDCKQKQYAINIPYPCNICKTTGDCSECADNPNTLLERMKSEHEFGTGGQSLPAMKIYLNSPLLPEAHEKFEDALAKFLSEYKLTGVIENNNTGNSTQFKPDCFGLCDTCLITGCC